MALRINPSINTFQEKIIIGKAHFNSVSPSYLIKEAIGQMIVRMTDTERGLWQHHYDAMTEEEKSETIASKGKKPTT